MKLVTHWYCSACTKQYDGSEAHTWIEFFINKHTKDPEFQGQTQFYESIERIGVCYACCVKAIDALGMTKTKETLLQAVTDLRVKEEIK